MKGPNRKRYIVFEIISNKELSSDMAERAILEGSLRFLGELGTSEAGIRFLPEFWHKNKSPSNLATARGTARGVLSANAVHIPKVKLVLALMKKISGHDVIIRSIKVFGTLKKIKSEN